MVVAVDVAVVDVVDDDAVEVAQDGVDCVVVVVVVRIPDDVVDE